MPACVVPMVAAPQTGLWHCIPYVCVLDVPLVPGSLAQEVGDSSSMPSSTWRDSTCTSLGNSLSSRLEAYWDGDREVFTPSVEAESLYRCKCTSIMRKKEHTKGNVTLSLVVRVLASSLCTQV